MFNTIDASCDSIRYHLIGHVKAAHYLGRKVLICGIHGFHFVTKLMNTPNNIVTALIKIRLITIPLIVIHYTLNHQIPNSCHP